jgi:hypothetical protein
VRLAEATVADREGRVEDAAVLYEEALAGGPIPLDATLDLAVLYWCATDYGFILSHRLPVEFLPRAQMRHREVLAEAARLFPGRVEVEFWRRYVAYVDRGEALVVEEARRWRRAHPQYLEPAAFVYLASQGTDAAEDARALVVRAREDPTTRKRYLASVVDAVNARNARRSRRR